MSQAYEQKQLIEAYSLSTIHSYDTIPSQRTESYLSYCELQNQSDLQKIKSDLLKLLPPSIIYSSQQGQNSIRVKQIKRTQNYEFIDLQVRIMNFTFKKISLMNSKTMSPMHRLPSNQQGCYSTVYSCCLNKVDLVFKCFTKKLDLRNIQGEKINQFKNVVVEFCLLKLASELKIGPKVYDILGYDIMIYNECLQFSMQNCNERSPLYSQKTVKNQLLGNLLKLHALNIVHQDIKIDNIRYSEQYGKYVFIDFGFGKVVQEPLGYKTYTKFRGSLTHVTEEMAAIFHSKTERMIDLYYNDLHALRLALKEIDYRDMSQQQYNSQQEYQLQSGFSESANQFHFFSYLKYCLYSSKDCDFQNIVQTLTQNQIQDLLQFLLNLNMTSKTYTAYMILLNRLRDIGYYQISFQQRNLSKFIKRDYFFLVEDDYLYQSIHTINDQFSMQSIEHDYLLNRRNILQMLFNPEIYKQLNLQLYCCLIAKTLDISTSYLKVQQCQNICIIAEKSRFFQSYSLQSKGDTSIERITNVIFQLCLQNNLNQRYYFILNLILGNIIIIHIQNFEKLIEIFKKILEVKIGIDKKVKILLKINSYLIWIQFLCNDWNSYQQFYLKFHPIYKTAIINLQKYCKSKQLQFLKTLLNREQPSLLQSPQFLLNIQDEYHKKYTTVWFLFLQIKCYNFSQHLYNKLKEQASILSFYNESIIQFYDFLMILGHNQKNELNRLSFLLDDLIFVLRIKRNIKAPFIEIMMTILNFKRKNYQKCSNFLSLLQNLRKESYNPIMDFVIQREIDRTIFQNRKFYNYSKSQQRALIQFSLQFCQRKFRGLKRPSVQKQLQSIVSSIIKQNRLKRFYERLFSQSYSDLKNVQINNFEVNLHHIMPTIIFQAHSKYQIVLKLIIYAQILVNKSKISQGITLTLFIYRIVKASNSPSYWGIDSHQLLQFILVDILQPISFIQPQMKIYAKDLYLQYYQYLIAQNRIQQFFHSTVILLNVLEILYRFKPTQIPLLICRLSKQLQLYNNQFNSQRYLQKLKSQIILHDQQVSISQISNKDISLQYYISIPGFKSRNNHEQSCKIIQNNLFSSHKLQQNSKTEPFTKFPFPLFKNLQQIDEDQTTVEIFQIANKVQPIRNTWNNYKIFVCFVYRIDFHSEFEIDKKQEQIQNDFEKIVQFCRSLQKQ